MSGIQVNKSFLYPKDFTYFNSYDFTEIVDNVISNLPKFEIDWNSTGLIKNNT